ncbi:DUF1513 domain-containing protein [Pacificoceanicola onchidii]|uniref:DUF1513 domain-containing protein n=1 Tax=Pacificoceanicola onchidii TaxID=2562685 RepID=UPI0010A4CBF5|nr:DUF1513 domain-containing protein [Pacificoceanicola onchidii]
MTTRRGFIASLLAASTTPALGWAAVGNPAYLAAAKEPDGAFALHGLSANGQSTFRIPLPARGHAGAGHPFRAEAVAFARRPGPFALVLDCARGDVIHRLTPPENRQFNGHGVYSADGSILYTSEQQSSDSAGFVGLWDVESGYRRIGEAPTGGLGPHEIHLLPDGATLVVANGGIATDAGNRRKLNTDQMRPSLVYLSTDGALLDRLDLAPELHQNSIRHLAIRKDGLVGFAMQWEGAPDAATPLLGLHRLGETPRLAEAPLAHEIAMKGYAGSVAFSGTGEEIAITSPRGNRLHRFTAEGHFLGAVSRSDICGLAPLADGYLASDGGGGLLAIEMGKPRALALHSCAWDNHIVTL